jgi:6-phosphogluconolactonase (cycloisomerase 2 family)
VLAVVVLLAIATLVACSSTYSASNDGLVLVPSAGSAVVQAFTFSLTNGHVSLLNTSPSTLGLPTAMVVDPTGSFAYATTVPNTAVTKTLSASSIVSYSVNSNGTLTGVGSTTMAPPPDPSCVSPCSVMAMPTALAMDSVGKFLFVADKLTTDTSGNPVPGTVSVFAIGSGGALTEVTGSPFTVPVLQVGPTTIANLLGLAVTPTKYPTLNTQSVQNAVCSLGPPLPASTPEYLYAADANNNVVWAFTVQPNGSLTLITTLINGIPVPVTFPADSVTTGVAVDPCNRFVFATNNNSNTVSAYAICNTTSPARPPICDANQYPDGYLVQITGSPFNLGGGSPNGPTVAAVDPLANFLYVLGNKSNTISCFRISQVNGTLAPLTPATIATGINPAAIAIRGDDNWLFVANNDTVNGFGIVSQYEITPASGVLTPFGTGIQTDNYPTAVAVK